MDLVPVLNLFEKINLILRMSMKLETKQDLESAEGRKMCFKETLKSPASPVKVIPFQLQFIIAEAEETAQPQYINYPAKAYSKNMSWLFEDKQT